MRLVYVCTCVRVRPNNFKTWVGKHSNRKSLGRVWEKGRNPKVQTSRDPTPPVSCLRRRRRPAGRAATLPTQGNDSFQWGQPAATCKWPGGCGRSHPWKAPAGGRGEGWPMGWLRLAPTETGRALPKARPHRGAVPGPGPLGEGRSGNPSSASGSLGRPSPRLPKAEPEALQFDPRVPLFSKA